jgi:putative transcriptional regulator
MRKDKTVKRGKRTYYSEIARDAHDAARAMHRLGIIDKKTMREFDIDCLTQVDELTADDIKQIREREGVSQAVFATALNITTNYVSQMERGTKRPRGATLKLLSLVKHKGLDAIL